MGEPSLTMITILTFPSSPWLSAEPAGHCTGPSTKAPSVPLHPSSCLSGAASSQTLEEVKGPGDSLAQSHHGGRGAGGAVGRDVDGGGGGGGHGGRGGGCGGGRLGGYGGGGSHGGRSKGIVVEVVDEVVVEE